MNNFCIDTLTIESDFHPENGILRIGEMGLTSDARLSADRLLQRARKEANEIVQGAHAQAQKAVRLAEKNAIESANHLLHKLNQTHAAFLAGAQEMVLDLAQGLFDRLVAEMSPRDRIDAALKRLLCETPPRLVHTVLHAHPEDIVFLPAVEWDVKPDLSLARGTCRLEASHGVWRADFNAAVASLKSALNDATMHSSRPASIDAASDPLDKA